MAGVAALRRAARQRPTCYLYKHDFDAVINEATFFVGHVIDAAVCHFAVSLPNEDEFFNRETDP
jgi:hypothetical protein